MVHLSQPAARERHQLRRRLVRPVRGVDEGGTSGALDDGAPGHGHPEPPGTALAVEVEGEEHPIVDELVVGGLEPDGGQGRRRPRRRPPRRSPRPTPRAAAAPDDGPGATDRTAPRAGGRAAPRARGRRRATSGARARCAPSASSSGWRCSPVSRARPAGGAGGSASRPWRAPQQRRRPRSCRRGRACRPPVDARPAPLTDPAVRYVNDGSLGLVTGGRRFGGNLRPLHVRARDRPPSSGVPSPLAALRLDQQNGPAPPSAEPCRDASLALATL